MKHNEHFLTDGVQQNFPEYGFMQNRELSWLEFNRRVLEESMDTRVPLWERLKFVSIFTTNLDEFFMIRVGSLTDMAMLENKNMDNKTGMLPKQQLDRIFEKVHPLYHIRDNAYQEIELRLREYGICNLSVSELEKKEKKYTDKYFRDMVFPLLSPQVVDEFHPFPHLQNKLLYIVCSFQDEENKIGIIPMPPILPDILPMPDSQLRFVMVEQIILQNVQTVYDMYKVEHAAIISVTRNADLSPEDEIFDIDDDFRERMKKVLKKRSRLAPVRLEVMGTLNQKLTDILLKKLNISKYQVFYSTIPIVLKYPFQLLNKIPSQIRNQLTYPPFEPVFSGKLNPSEPMINQCRKKDIILFFPYHSISPFITLLKESAENPNVVSIKITIYRLASDSRIVDCLCRAAENKKEVTVLIELKARFDEENNIGWAEKLENAGCNVIYGFEKFKVHSKVCLITLFERNKLSYITQIGTGNYNEDTSKLYSDLSLMTANQEIGKDASDFFKNLSVSNLNGQYAHLLVSPYGFKKNLMILIEHEIEQVRSGKEGKILIKANSLTDKELIEKLSLASRSGVKVDLLIRGICCLLPGIKGKTENIHVRSIVGRYLEHARIYCFGSEEQVKIYISSADMMTRNMSKRVEIGCPILDSDVRKYIQQILENQLRDNAKARMMKSDGTFEMIESQDPFFDSQQYFSQMANMEKEQVQERTSGGIPFLTKLKKLFQFKKWMEESESSISENE